MRRDPVQIWRYVKANGGLELKWPNRVESIIRDKIVILGRLPASDTGGKT